MKAFLFLPLCLLFRPFAETTAIADSNRLVSPGTGGGLFDSDELLNIKLTGNVRDVLGDRRANPKYFDFTVACTTTDGAASTVPVRVRTRGHFRRDKSNCSYPPLLLNFTNKNQPASSLFYDRDKVKLVMPCKGDEYVVKEYLVYKLYNLITPLSFKARLVKVTLDDSVRKKLTGPFYGILLEEEESMAKRNGRKAVQPKMLKPQQTETESFLTMAVFQYMIGNTDWSTQYRQNIKFLVKEPNDLPIVVPYDFDHSGMVNAPYAQPAEELLMSSVTERRYRGYCIMDMKTFDPVLAKFNRLKDAFYKVITSCSYLDSKTVRNVTKYLDDFFAVINNPKEMARDFSYPCDKNGTGNIVIKGLREED